MNRQQTSSINIRNFIGTESHRTSRPLSVISMLPRADAGGLQASTVTYFVLSVSCAIRGHSRSEISLMRKPTFDQILKGPKGPGGSGRQPPGRPCLILRRQQSCPSPNGVADCALFPSGPSIPASAPFGGAHTAFVFLR